MPWLALVAVLALLSSAAAHSAIDPDRLARLLQMGQSEAAYDLGRSELDSMAGDVEFDLYFGLAALETGHIGEAIFALERVLIAQPGADRARLGLARALFQRGDDRRARRAFETVLARDPPEAVAARIQRYLDAIARRSDRYTTRVSGYVEAGAGYDDNVNRATEADAVDTILGSVALDEDSQASGDEFGVLETGASVSHPVAPGVNLLAMAAADGRFHADESDFDRSAVNLHAGVRLRGEASELTALLGARRFRLDGDAFRDQYSVGLDGRYTVSERWAGTARLDLARIDYTDRNDLDADLALARIGAEHRWTGTRSAMLAAGLLAGVSDAEEDTNRAQSRAQRDITGLWAQGAIVLWRQWSLHGDLELRHNDYGEANILFGRVRDEDFQQAELALDWRPSGRWQLGPRLRYARNDANIDLFDYERTEIAVEARYVFH